MKAEQLKLLVKDKYGTIAGQSMLLNTDTGCSTNVCCDKMDYTVFSDDYSNLVGYNPNADLGLGCGIPTQFAEIKKGEHVLDLGSGAGNDCFVAGALVGYEGEVTGIDFTDAMLEKANKNLEKTGFKNISFVKGDIENMPLPKNSFDIVISNCVLNLVPDKERAFSEIYRVLKPGGRFCISDVVLMGELPKKLKEAAEMYAGCVSGALQKSEYLSIIGSQGFQSVEVKKEKLIQIPDNIILNYIDSIELQELKHNNVGIFSITVNAIK